MPNRSDAGRVGRALSKGSTGSRDKTKISNAKEIGNSHICLEMDVTLGRNVKLSKFINLYGCAIGDETKIGPFVEVQKNATIGKRCKISSHTFVCEGVNIEDSVFIGHGVMFINDRYPRATNTCGKLQTEADWQVEPTIVRAGASIGSGATVLSGVTIGANAIVGAGSTVTKSVPENAIVAGNPARLIRYLAGTDRSAERAECTTIDTPAAPSVSRNNISGR